MILKIARRTTGANFKTLAKNHNLFINKEQNNCSEHLINIEKSPLFTITTNLPTILDLLLKELIDTYLLTVDHPVDLCQEFEHSVRYENFGLEHPTTDSIQRIFWRIDYYGRVYLMKFLSYNKRFTKAMNALSTYHSAHVDQPAASRITAALTESWFRRFQLYRKTRKVFHKLLKNMNLRREQLKVWVVTEETKASSVQDFDNKIAIDHLAIRKLAGPDTVWYNDSTNPPSASLEDIPNINDIDENYAGRALLSMDTSTHAHLDLSPASGGGMGDLGAGAGEKKAFASDDEAPASLESVTPPGQESTSAAATPVAESLETKSPTDPPYHFWLMAFLVVTTSTVVTVGPVVTMLATLLSSLLPTMSLLALVDLLLSQRKRLKEERKDPLTEILTGADIPAAELVTSASASSSLEQSLLVSSSSTISGESFDVMNSSMTAPSFDRYNSSMTAINSLITQFKETQDDATFILSSIDDNHGMGPLQVADHCASLRDVMTLMRKMASALGALTRNQSHLVTLDSLAFMQDSLDDLANRRTVCYRNPDEKPEDAETVSDV